MRALSVRLALLALLAGVGSGCGDLSDHLTTHNDQVATAAFNSVLPAAGRTRLQVEGVTGTITIGGDLAADELRIGGTRRVAAASLSEAQNRLAGLQVEVEPDLDVVRVRTVQPQDTGSREYTVDYTITLPARMAVDVRNVTGTVRVSGITGAVAADLVTGDVRLERIVGATSVSLVTGSIQTQVTLPPLAAITLATVTGDIALRIPTATSAMLAAQVVTGATAVANLTLLDEHRSPTSLRARLGTGQGTIALSAVTGAITITGF